MPKAVERLAGLPTQPCMQNLISPRFPLVGGILWPALIGPADRLKFIHITWLAVKLTRREPIVAPVDVALVAKHWAW